MSTQEDRITRRPYNGFSAQQRDAVGLIFTELHRSGLLARPTRCEACGQTEGWIGYHHEDYSDLWAVWPFCYRCHMVIHSRHHSDRAWDIYRVEIAEGFQFPATGAYGVIQRDHFRNLHASESLWPSNMVPGVIRLARRERPTILDRIDSGELLPGTPEERQARFAELLGRYRMTVPYMIGRQRW